MGDVTVTFWIPSLGEVTAFWEAFWLVSGLSFWNVALACFTGFVKPDCWVWKKLSSRWDKEEAMTDEEIEMNLTSNKKVKFHYEDTGKELDEPMIFDDVIFESKPKRKKNERKKEERKFSWKQAFLDLLDWKQAFLDLLDFSLLEFVCTVVQMGSGFSIGYVQLDQMGCWNGIILVIGFLMIYVPHANNEHMPQDDMYDFRTKMEHRNEKSCCLWKGKWNIDQYSPAQITHTTYHTYEPPSTTCSNPLHWINICFPELKGCCEFSETCAFYCSFPNCLVLTGIFMISSGFGGLVSMFVHSSE